MIENQKKGWSSELEADTQLAYARIVDFYMAIKGRLLDPDLFTTDEMVYLAMDWLARAQDNFESTVGEILPQLEPESQILFFQAFVDKGLLMEDSDRAVERAREIRDNWQKNPNSILPLIRQGIEKTLRDYYQYFSKDDIVD
jgi:hypothetical protein